MRQCHSSELPQHAIHEDLLQTWCPAVSIRGATAKSLALCSEGMPDLPGNLLLPGNHQATIQVVPEHHSFLATKAPGCALPNQFAGAICLPSGFPKHFTSTTNPGPWAAYTPLSTLSEYWGMGFSKVTLGILQKLPEKKV